MTLPPDSVHFRKLVIDAVSDDESFIYLSADTFLGTCPVCATAVAVRFHGTAARADLNCHGGCSEAEIAGRIGMRVRP